MGLNRTSQEEFRIGEQRDVAPHLLDPRAVYGILNGLLDDDGSIYKRGGSASHANAPFGASLRMSWEGWLQPGRRTLLASGSAFGVLDADDATPRNLGGSGFLGVPGNAHALQDLLFIDGGTIYGGSRKTVDYEAGTVTVTKGSPNVEGAGTSWLANVDPGMLLRLPGENRVYVVASVMADTLLSLRGAYEGATAAGAAYTLKRLETASAPYPTSGLYAVAAKRLIACQGNTITFSEPDKPHVLQAHIAPLETVVQNLHELEEGVQILGAESVGVDRLMVFHTQGITAISNLSTTIVDALGASQHRIEKQGGTVLWGNGAGIASYDGSLIVPTLEDIYMMDGVSAPTGISQSIIPIYRRYIQEGFVPGSAFVYRNHYFLPVIDSGGAPQDLLMCRLDRPVWMGRHLPYRWPWTAMGGSGAKIAGGVARAPTGPNDPPKALAACADGKLINVATFFEPTAAVKHDHDGTTALFSLITRDFPSGQLSIGRFRKLRLLYELDADEGENPLISAGIGTGINREPVPKWDEVTWDEFLWSAVGEIIFEELAGAAPPNAGAHAALAQNAWTWYLNTRARYARFRLQASAPVAKLTIRSLEIFAAQVGGVRQAKVVDS